MRQICSTTNVSPSLACRTLRRYPCLDRWGQGERQRGKQWWILAENVPWVNLKRYRTSLRVCSISASSILPDLNLASRYFAIAHKHAIQNQVSILASNDREKGIRVSSPIISAGLFSLLLMKNLKASLIASLNLSSLEKHTSTKERAVRRKEMRFVTILSSCVLSWIRFKPDTYRYDPGSASVTVRYVDVGRARHTLRCSRNALRRIST